MSASQVVSGACLCGKITLTVKRFNRDVVVCHCTQCRKQTGHFLAATRARNEHLAVVGEENITWYRASQDAERGFCRICGATLFWRKVGAANTSIAAGCLDAPTGLRVISHIYTDNKGDYYQIESDVPSFRQSGQDE